MTLFRFALAALIVASPVFAQTKSKAPAAKSKTAAKPKAAAKAKPKTPPVDIQPLSHAEKSGFSALQVAAPDSAKFIAGWKLGAGGSSATTRTVANKPLFTFIIFRGCKADAAGNCNVVADFVIHRPDGTTNDENRGVVLWNKAAPPDPKKPYLSDGALVYGVDSEGPFGDYRIVATTTDRVAGTTLTTEQTLTITPGSTAKSGAPTKSDAAKPADAAPSDASSPEPAPAPAGPTLPTDPPEK